MTRKFTLFLASMLIVFSAGATMPMTDNGSMEQQSVTIATEDGDDDGYWWGASFDIASNYLWRGYDQSYRGGNRTMFDPALQGGVTFGYGKFYIDLWANHSLISKYNEFDIFLGFEHENLTITAYDVLWGVRGDMGSDLQYPMSLVIIGGMVVGTLISVLFIPLAYYEIYRYGDEKR